MMELNDEQLEMVAGGSHVKQENTATVIAANSAYGAYAESDGDVTTIKSGGKNAGFWEATATNVKSPVTANQSISVSLSNKN